MLSENKAIKRSELLAKHKISTSMLWPLICDGYIAKSGKHYVELKPLDITEYRKKREQQRRQKLSNATVRYYKDENHRKEQSKRLKNYRKCMTDEQRHAEHDRFSELMKSVMSSDKVRKNVSDGMKQMLSNPDNYQKHIDTMKKHLLSEEACAKRSSSIKDFWSNASPEYHKRHSEHIKAGQEKSGAREKISEASKRFWQTEEYRQKQIDTKLANGTFGSSREEDYCYEQLCNVFSEVKRQYRTKDYPFLCDFYIPEIDLYIEYNGYYTHQPDYGFFDKNDKRHLDNLERLKSLAETSVGYQDCVSTWAIKDILKRDTAIQNNLNWIAFFNVPSFEDWLAEQA